MKWRFVADLLAALAALIAVFVAGCSVQLEATELSAGVEVLVPAEQIAPSE